MLSKAEETTLYGNDIMCKMLSNAEETTLYGNRCINEIVFFLYAEETTNLKWDK